MRLRRLVVAGTAAILAFGLWPATQAVHAASTYTVGVDNATPAGHNYEYVDFFPRGPFNVGTGDTIDLKWNAGSPDGFHTATLLKAGETAQSGYGEFPIAVGDGDDSGTQLQGNPAAFGPTHPPAGSGAPGACGNAATPCSYDGSSDLNSGARPTAPGGDFFVTVNATPGASVTYICLIHPGMTASFNVVGAGGGDPPANVASAAAAQYASDTTEANAAEASANTSSVSTRPDGTHVVSMTAGTASQHVEVLEMLPNTVNVTAGDTVSWTTSTIKDIHTVTFPNGHGSDAIDPLPMVCEGAGSSDPPAPGGPPPLSGCPSPAETHVNPQPQAAARIPTPSTLGTSGVISSSPAPFPHSYSMTMPTSGSFLYQCRIHDHMTGTITAADRSSQPYWEVASDGGIFSFGGAQFAGSEGAATLNKPMVGMAATPAAEGYWTVASDGGVFTFGDAHFFGSAGALVLNKPVVGMAARPDGLGYWLVASDGGVFTYGDAPFVGSAGGIKLNKPVVGMAATPDGNGYWLVASDGGVFTYGDAGFFGSAGGINLNKPVVGMAARPDGLGYWLVASDGGVFTYGDAGFFGSAGALPLNAPVEGMSATPKGKGYWLSASDGGIFSYGDAKFSGSMGGARLNKPVVGMASA